MSRGPRRAGQIVGGHTLGKIAKRAYRCDTCGVLTPYRPDYFCTAKPCNGTTFTHFGSMGEARRYAELMLQQSAGQITELRRQVPYDLLVGSTKIGTYVADFVYDEVPYGQVVEDYHPVDTALSKWKRKHFEAQYGYPIRVTN